MKIFFGFVVWLWSFSLAAQNADSTWIVNNYTKIERQIPMRDGIKLFTSVYIPKDRSEQHPLLLVRTPYSSAPYGEDKFASIWSGYKMAYARRNYIFVTQDVRGRYMSEGKFEDVRPFKKDKKATDTDEASDTYDTIEWLVKNIENNNGKVGIMGISYPGFYATQASSSNHPALKAVSPQAPVTNWFIGDDFHHNGAFFMMDAFSFYPVFGKPHPQPTTNYGTGFSSPIKDNYTFFLKAGAIKNLATMIGDSIRFWHELYQHPDYDDWWKARDARVALYNIKPAMLWVGGLFDAEDCWGAWNAYKACEKQSPQTNSKIVMGPWFHGQWTQDGSYLGNVRFGSKTGEWYQQNIEFPFFNDHLRGEGTVDSIAEATIFFTGENTWKKFDQWPAKNVVYKNLFIQPDGSLSFENYGVSSPPTNKVRNRSSSIGKSQSSISKGYSEYTSDPAHPVPYTEGVHHRRTREYMTDDQRFAARRPDVLSFETPELEEDLTLAGPVIANLLTSINTTDADFVVKLIDVFPDDFKYDSTMVGNGNDYPMGGYQLLVRGEIMRGKYRNSFEKPSPFIPNKITTVKYELPDVAHTFKKGHRLMIQIQSSWFPLADRNPQKFTNIYTASDSDFQKAVIRIFHNAEHSTKFILPVLN